MGRKKDKNKNKENQSSSGASPVNNSGVTRSAAHTKQRYDELKALCEAKKKEFAAADGKPYSDRELRSLMGAMTQKLQAGRTVTGQEIASFGYDVEMVEYKAPPYSMRKALRLEFGGEIMTKPENESGFYRQRKAAATPITASPEEYDAKNNTFLAACSEFKSFEGYKDDLFGQMAKTGIKPSEIGRLKEEDIYDLMVEVCATRGTLKVDSRDRTRVYQGRNGERAGSLFEGVRTKFLKMLSTEYSDSLKKAFMKDGMNEEKASETIRLMQEQGQQPQGYNTHHKFPIGGSSKGVDVNALDNFVLIKVLPCHDMIHSYQDNIEGLKNYHNGVGRAESDNVPTVMANIPMPQKGVLFFGGPDKDLQVTVDQSNARLKEKTISPVKNEIAAKLANSR